MSGRSSNLRERLRNRESSGPANELIRELDFDEAYLVRCLAYLLRHSPHENGVALDSRGWAPVGVVVVALRRLHWSLGRITGEKLAAFVLERAHDRFELAADQVRARYGHSLHDVVVADPETPPEILFHGTTRDALAAIREHGLRPMGRSYVHLTSDLAYAERVAGAAGQDWIVLRVRASQAAGAGAVFRKASSHVWLADVILPSHIDEHALAPPVCTETLGQGELDSRTAASTHLARSLPSRRECVRSLEELDEEARVLVNRTFRDGLDEPAGPATGTPFDMIPRKEEA